MVRALFLDCDDCLYQNGWRTEQRVTNAIRAYLESIGVDGDRAFELYEKHGMTLKGLLSEGQVDEAGAETFLRAAHDVDYGDIQCDAPLSALLGELRLPTWIFTEGTREHAQRCIDALGLSALRLQGIVDVRVCKFESKHAPSSFEAALQTARATDPSLRAADCCLVDDSERNIQRAHTMGCASLALKPSANGTHSRCLLHV
jgi:pyrimidine 5'-nucleotidase